MKKLANALISSSFLFFGIVGGALNRQESWTELILLGVGVVLIIASIAIRMTTEEG